ncbi:hypothetical protein HNR42_002714 [Deinobacterium chartae]|uniref:Uncharacterized protein n=1 Tax=Deinobacterium chartae TaxID=521158 RepID=A0A841I2I4_9DEIO|nr:hypothetical protein [Deinobacterium chartae]MBB6099276.1 hypothetical protein [Deinobacterium chartae]
MSTVAPFWRYLLIVIVLLAGGYAAYRYLTHPRPPSLYVDFGSPLTHPLGRSALWVIEADRACYQPGDRFLVRFAFEPYNRALLRGDDRKLRIKTLNDGGKLLAFALRGPRDEPLTLTAESFGNLEGQRWDAHGRALTPDTENLEPLPTRVGGGRVEIDLERFRCPTPQGEAT